MKKYEFTGETKERFGRTLHRIRAVTDFGGVVAGELGGWIEKEDNLSHNGNAWVYSNAQVYGNARVCDLAQIFSRKAIMTISGIGSRDDTTTFFALKDKQIGVTCGCFHGTIDEFAAKVQKTHGDNEHGKAYMLAIELAKLRIDTNVPEEAA